MKRTIEKTIVEIVNENPDGITGINLSEEVQERFACSSPGSALASVKKKRLIKCEKKIRCGCGRNNDMYYPS